MKRLLSIFIYILLFSIALSAQTYYGWITDIHIGYPDADIDLENVVHDINSRNEIQFVVATGDISEQGKDAQLELAKKILDSLSVPYYIIPGNHDTKWSESGCTKFKELWGDNKFVFEKNGIKHIGLNSGIPWRGGGGHIAPQDLKWLKDNLENTSENEEVVFYVHHPLDKEVDNWFKVTNILRNYNTKAILVGHGHANRLMEFDSIPGAMSRSTLSKGKKSWGYTLVENRPDSLLFYEIDIDSTPNLWGAIAKNNEDSAPEIDSLQYINYNDNISALWQKDLGTTLSASLLVSGDKIFAASTEGTVYCFNINGNLEWKYDTGEAIFSRPVRDKDVLAVATIQGDLISLNVNTGKVIQIIGLGEPLTSQLVKFPATYNGQKTSAILIGTGYGNMYCYDLYSFEMIWENSSAKGMIETRPLLLSDRVVYGSWDGHLYCVDLTSGTLNWKWTENNNFYYSPAACWPVSDGKNVFVATPDKHVSAVDILLGTTTWRKKDFESWESIGISTDKKDLYIKSFKDNFYIVSAKNGKKVKKLEVNYGLDTMPIHIAENGGNVIFGSKNGNIYLIDQKYNWKPLFFNGTCRVQNVEHVKDNVYAASNMDGKIILFTLNNN